MATKAENQRVYDGIAAALEEVKRIRRGEIEPVNVYRAPGAREIREGMDLSQSEFATVLGVSKRTIQSWEQGTRQPAGPAAALLRVAATDPEAVLRANELLK